MVLVLLSCPPGRISRQVSVGGAVDANGVDEVWTVASLVCQPPCVSEAEIDAYLSALPEPQRSTLEEMRRRIREVVPDAEQGMSYGVPAFKVAGRTVCGFAAFKHHLSYLPHSGSVLAALEEELGGRAHTKSSLHFSPGEPLPRTLVRRLIEAKLRATG